MKIGDIVTIKKNANLSHLEYRKGLLGNTFTVVNTDGEKYVKVNYDGGLWVNVEAIESVNNKTKIEAKIAVMYKRFANCKGN
jgi:hypothetical protein